MPRISVVVPIYNVEEFLEECLESLAAQTFGDFEAVLVDDGSTDGGPEIAERFTRRDARFRMLRQPNGGLSRARNAGVDAATPSPYLHFLDSDDVLAPTAYERLVATLDATGSDFATGNVHRLTHRGTAQAGYIRHVFGEDRPKTHITRDRRLLADRTAWNKLWRRTFWDEHAFRFPEGRVYEDIPVTIPAHFRARAVDVVAEPVYFWRLREGGGLSITQRRLEHKQLLDRLLAIEEVRRFLAEHAPRKAKRWYDESILADDLRYFVNVLDGADEAYLELFLDRVVPLVEQISERALHDVPAIERLKWHLVRHRRVPELMEVLRFQREDLRHTPPVVISGRAYGDYPYRTDPELAIPAEVYRLRQELTLTARLDELRLERRHLHLRGWSFIDGLGAPAPRAQRLSLVAVRRGPLRRVRYVVTGIRLRVREIHRPEATAVDGRLCDADWSGFEATLDLGRLRTGRRWRDGTWELFVSVRSGLERRRRVRWFLDGPRPLQAVELQTRDGVLVRASTAETGEVLLEVDTAPAVLRRHAVEDDELVVAGDAGAPADGKLTLEARREDGTARRRAPAATGPDGTFTARMALARLLDGAVRAGTDDEQGEAETQGPADEIDEGAVASADSGDDADAEPEVTQPWALALATGGRRRPLALPAGGDGARFPVAGHEVAVSRTARGEARLEVRRPSAVVTEAGWTADGVLELAGEWPSAAGAQELVLQPGRRSEQRVVDVELDAGGRFRARLRPAAMPTLGGHLPLPEGWWGLYTHPPGEHDDATLTHVVLAPDVQRRLPLTTTVAHKPFALGMRRTGGAVLIAQRDLDADERGGWHQLRLRRTTYAGRRSEPLRDAVVYSSFRGRQYSDNPRMIHEELVRRGAPLEHLWVVRDGQAEVPPTATVLREGSREFHEALARSRFVVFNDHFPPWFKRRPDQVCLQTWHGTPLKRLGLDVSVIRRTARRFEHRWAEQVVNWQYVVSPNRFTTRILRRAYAIEGEMLETGYPRNDVLAGAGREARTRALRARLGLPEDRRIVLYAPTYRDQVVDRRGRHRLDLRLDVDRLRDAVGEDTVVLFRKHHYVVDAAPATPDGFVRDVSTYPDGTELLLAADVLVTDYSSMMFDFASTGRPMLFFTYDLEAYEERIRGCYFPLPERAPGPLLNTTDELADALRDLDGVHASHAARYRAFQADFCELDDGHASTRVVDRVFGAP